MADTVFQSYRFPPGTVVDFYPDAQCSERKRSGTGPFGLTATDSATVDSAGVLTVDGLTAKVPYLAHAAIPLVAVSVAAAEKVAGATAANEIQTVTVSNATGGTSAWTYSGQTTAAIAFDATPATVQAALEALSNLAAGDVLVYGSAGAYTIEFAGTLKETDVALLSVDGALLTGPVEHRYVQVTGAA